MAWSLSPSYEVALYTGLLLGLFLLLRLAAQYIHSLLAFFGEARLVVDPRLNNVQYPVSYWTEKGKRPYQEDRFHATKATKHDTSLYGVFDGHGGARAAQFTHDHLFARLSTDHTFPADPATALTNGFLSVDADFSREARSRGWNDGSTCVVTAITSSAVYCANAGDSRAILLRRSRAYLAHLQSTLASPSSTTSQSTAHTTPSSTSSSTSPPLPSEDQWLEAVPLSLDHRPERRDEEARIRALGGKLMHWGRWRVEGVLAVSRAIGDVALQPFITARPELTQRARDAERDVFVVLASDGLWDVLENAEVAQLLSQRVAQYERRRHLRMLRRLRHQQLRALDRMGLGARDSFSLPPGTSLSPLQLTPEAEAEAALLDVPGDADQFKIWAQELCAEAIRRGSPDNITVLIVDLRADEADGQSDSESSGLAASFLGRDTADKRTRSVSRGESRGVKVDVAEELAAGEQNESAQFEFEDDNENDDKLD